MNRPIAIIGDRFMLPSFFERALREKLGGEIATRSLEFAWPDEPMHHGYAVAGMEGLKEYMGNADQVVDFVGDSEIFITHLAPVSAEMFKRMPNLRFVAVSRGGAVNIDMAAARERNVRVVNTPGRNSSAVAEFTIGAILTETRNIRKSHESLRIGKWRGDLYRTDMTGEELSEMTVGVIGYGHVGTKVVKLLKAFGCRILVSDPYAPLSKADLEDGVEAVSLDRILAESDVVTLHPRVTPETTRMMGREAFAAMKRGSYFINTARGPLVDYDALYEALTNGNLRGAAIETFAIEPVPADWPLLKLDNVTLTPHLAGSSVQTVSIAANGIAEEVRRYLTGEPPLNPC
jgi:D-3-phosphoglycerate dehydrogenase / 2-oxoglutarate reductase